MTRLTVISIEAPSAARTNGSPAERIIGSATSPLGRAPLGNDPPSDGSPSDGSGSSEPGTDDGPKASGARAVRPWPRGRIAVSPSASTITTVTAASAATLRSRDRLSPRADVPRARSSTTAAATSVVNGTAAMIPRLPTIVRMTSVATSSELKTSARGWLLTRIVTISGSPAPT